MKIEPVEFINGSYRTGTLSKYSVEQIESILGFPSNVDDDPDKVIYSWAFTVDGYKAAIWDWKGSHQFGLWSVYDPHNILGNLFVID